MSYSKGNIEPGQTFEAILADGTKVEVYNDSTKLIVRSIPGRSSSNRLAVIPSSSNMVELHPIE